MAQMITCDVWNFCVISRSTVSKNWKNSAIEEAKEAQVAVTERRAERENHILFNNLWVLDIFVSALVSAQKIKFSIKDFFSVCAVCHNNAKFLGFSLVCLESLVFL